MSHVSLFILLPLISLLCIPGLHGFNEGMFQGKEPVVNATSFNQYLLSASNTLSPEGIPQTTLTITSSHPDSDPLTYIFPNHPLSPACANHVTRCRQLFVIQEEESQLVGILFPLNNSIGLMVFNDRGENLVHHTTYTLHFEHHQDCVPIAIVEFKKNNYTVCIDPMGRIISCLINLQFENITQSYLQCSTSGLFRSPIDYSLISNIVWVDQNDYLMFIFGHRLYRLYPERSTISISVFQFPQNHFPTNVQLVYSRVQNELIIHYFDSQLGTIYIAFDLSVERWERFHNNTNLEYSCFNGYSVFVFPGFSVILYEKQKPQEEEIVPTQINITGNHFITGLCFGNTTHPYFVYVDQSHGIFILDIRTLNSTTLSTSVCARGECQIPILYQSRYLLLREGQGSLVVKDIEQEYKSVILSTDHGSRLTGFFTGRAYQISSENPGNDNNEGISIYIPIAAGVLSVFVLTACIGILLISLGHIIYRRKQALKRAELARETAIRSNCHTLPAGTRCLRVETPPLNSSQNNAIHTVDYSESDKSLPSQPHQSAVLSATTNPPRPSLTRVLPPLETTPSHQSPATSTPQSLTTYTRNMQATAPHNTQAIPPRLNSPATLTDLSTAATPTHTPSEGDAQITTSDSLLDLYPERRGATLDSTEAQALSHDTNRRLSTTTMASSISSRSHASLQGLTRGNYEITGASNNDIDALQPVQASDTGNHQLRHDGPGVLCNASDPTSIQQTIRPCSPQINSITQHLPVEQSSPPPT